MIILFIILHIITTLIYFFYNFSKKQFGQKICEGVIILLLPVFGLFFLTMMHFIDFFVIKSEKPFYMYEGVSRRQYYVNSISEKEINIMPIEDTLLLEDKILKREILKEVIIKTPLESTGVFKDALNDKDSEISHYAASAIMGKKNKLEQKIRNLEEKLRIEPLNVTLMRKYIYALEIYFNSGLIDVYNSKEIEINYANTLEKLFLQGVSDKKVLEKLINVQIGLENYEKANKYCEKFSSIYPEDEAPFLMYIKLYFKIQQYDNLKRKIFDLKNSEIKFSHNTLEIIRFWDEGRCYEV